MKCRDVIDIIPFYMDQTLCKETARKVKFHIDTCDDCHTEYIVWKESSLFFMNEQQHLHSSPIQRKQDSSIMHQVMNRITTEEKWALPVSNKAVKLSSVTHRWISTLCVLLLLVFGVVMFGAVSDDPVVTYKEKQADEWSVTSIVMSIDQVQAIPSENKQHSDIRHRIVANIGDSIFFEAKSHFATPNFYLVMAFLGILVTVVSMNWFSRT